MKLRELLNSLEYTVVQGTDDIEVSDFIYDSRKVIEGCSFVCIKGYAADGHKYAADAIEKGATSLIVTDDVDVPLDVTVIKVPDARITLSKMSAEYFGNPAKELRKRFDEELISLMLKLQWWNKSIAEIDKLIPILTCSDLKYVRGEIQKLVSE